MHHLIYLHGFLSSPQSLKAKQTLAYAMRHYPSLNVHIPELPGDIDKVLKKVGALVASVPDSRLGFIGSSMGGYLSTYCIEKLLAKDCQARAVLVNPAVQPYHLLDNYLGKHVNPYTKEQFFVTTQHIKALKQIDSQSLAHANKYKVLLQTGDETLDYRLAVAKYGAENCVIEQGGDHSFQGYGQHLKAIFAFLFAQS